MQVFCGDGRQEYAAITVCERRRNLGRKVNHLHSVYNQRPIAPPQRPSTIRSPLRALYPSLHIITNEISDDLVRAGRVMMEIYVVARIRMEIGDERARILVKSPRRLFEYALTFTVANNIVLLAGDGQCWPGEVGCVCT